MNVAVDFESEFDALPFDWERDRYSGEEFEYWWRRLMACAVAVDRPQIVRGAVDPSMKVFFSDGSWLLVCNPDQECMATAVCATR